MPVHLRRPRSRPFAAAAVAVLGSASMLLVGPASAAPGAPARDNSQVPNSAQQLPGSFTWSSTGPLIAPAGHLNSASAKDPSVVQDQNGTWHVFFTTAQNGDWGLAHTSFTDWSQAATAPQVDLEADSAIGRGYRAAPHAFYFEPTGEWYLVYQTGLPSYSTTKNPDDPTSWSAPKNFMDSVPEIVKQNIGDGSWLDFFVTCDDAKCYLFSADDNGHVYRSETTLQNFPNGFGNTRIVLQDTAHNLFEGGAVYRVGDSNTYLMMWEAIGSDSRRWYRSFTSEGLDGRWKPLADTEDTPFARSNNVTFDDGKPWTRDISHGELIRSTNNQTMTIDPCHLQLVYQGVDPAAGGPYEDLPYRIAKATHTNPDC